MKPRTIKFLCRANVVVLASGAWWFGHIVELNTNQDMMGWIFIVSIIVAIGISYLEYKLLTKTYGKNNKKENQKPQKEGCIK